MNAFWNAPQKDLNHRPGNQGNRSNNKGNQGNASGNQGNRSNQGNQGNQANRSNQGNQGNSPVANSSFIAAPLESIKNVANHVVEATNTAVNNASTHVANSVNNVMNSDAVASLTEPIQESINGMNESDSFLSMAVILSLGLCMVIFIVIVIFRDQITMGAELLWHKIKKAFSSEASVAKPVAPALHPVDEAAIDRLLPGKKEVFNIAQDKYTYSDAEPLCKAFGAELATYDQVKSAWNKGADWCNYGWIKGQAAVYPTQSATYDKLQAGPEDQRMACGVVGVNGGYFDNPELRFGVNCYGVKPSENEADVRHIMANPKSMTPGALAYDKKVQDYKHQKEQIPVNPFKTDKWSS